MYFYLWFTKINLWKERENKGEVFAVPQRLLPPAPMDYGLIWMAPSQANACQAANPSPKRPKLDAWEPCLGDELPRRHNQPKMLVHFYHTSYIPSNLEKGGRRDLRERQCENMECQRVFTLYSLYIWRTSGGRLRFSVTHSLLPQIDLYVVRKKR